MKTDRYGRIVYDESDLCDLLLENPNGSSGQNFLVDTSVSLHKLQQIDFDHFNLHPYQDLDLSIQDFDQQCQSVWFMPKEYQDLDIAEYVLSLCKDQNQLQRCGQELLMFQERNLFNLLKYLKYLVDTMTQNKIIWGVGRGSSVASYVLYLLGVHRVDSIYYQLDINEFLR